MGSRHLSRLLTIKIRKEEKYMCGIAGLIHRGKSSKVGHELQGMLQALKHRGEDSTGYALYGDTDGKNFIMRFKVGENVGEGSTSVAEDVSVYDERKKIVDNYLNEMGAKIIKEERILPYSLRYEIEYNKKDLLEFSWIFLFTFTLI